MTHLHTSGEPPRLYKAAEAATITGLTAHWLTSHARAKQIPHWRFGKLIRFSRAHLDEIVQQAHQPVTVGGAK
ncbi:helix-turn-helix domain-containing protein [Actinomadura harenae]|uniref:DNA-binding protein n=1 Tax=Actinomadura harenae TaxID=2483351 RepID=A0A3M2LS47_9ACTN|nr:helix-turn-helix domain-containing protein [Actinomadura harenae]RMI39906.1 DNA-binding protein [Actinomadura harenae]